MPKVSVIMPTYNCEYVVGDAIESIIAQTYPDWELVICDDCSGDGTVRVIKEYMVKDPRIRLIVNDVNSGCGLSCNNAIMASSGEYLARMDADDLSMPERFEEQVSFLDTHPQYAFVGAGCDIFNRDGVYARMIYMECPDKRSFRTGAKFIHAALMLRRGPLLEIGLYKDRKQVGRSEDFDMLTELYAAGYKGFNLQKILYKYRVEDEDLKKRKFKYRLKFALLCNKAFKKLDLKWYDRIYAIRPILAGLIPRKLLNRIHRLIYKS